MEIKSKETYRNTHNSQYDTLNENYMKSKPDMRIQFVNMAMFLFRNSERLLFFKSILLFSKHVHLQSDSISVRLADIFSLNLIS